MLGTTFFTQLYRALTVFGNAYMRKRKRMVHAQWFNLDSMDSQH
jgi:hypothetical protein